MRIEKGYVLTPTYNGKYGPVCLIGDGRGNVLWIPHNKMIDYHPKPLMTNYETIFSIDPNYKGGSWRPDTKHDPSRYAAVIPLQQIPPQFQVGTQVQQQIVPQIPLQVQPIPQLPTNPFPVQSPVQSVPKSSVQSDPKLDKILTDIQVLKHGIATIIQYITVPQMQQVSQPPVTVNQQPQPAYQASPIMPGSQAVEDDVPDIDF